MDRFTRRACALASACLALTLALAPAALAQRAPIGGTLALPIPTAPDFPALQASAAAVTLNWTDRATDEDRFVISKRDTTGAWKTLADLATHGQAQTGETYTYTDSAHDVSGQCYRVAAINVYGAGTTSERCTVRPDPAEFPQTVPSSAKQWAGLNSVNDGTGDLLNLHVSHLKYGHETFGVDLDWSDDTTLWRIKAEGGPQLMYGQAVALRAWGGGWLRTGSPLWGIGLAFSDTPAYEWTVLGSTPGTPIGGGAFALYNRTSHDFLVNGLQLPGVDLNWYRNTVTAPPSSPSGVRELDAYNCTDEERPVEMWVQDLTAGDPLSDRGWAVQLWNGSSCNLNQPWKYTPQPGHQYLIEAVDNFAPGCTNDPTWSECVRMSMTVLGDAHGPVASTVVS
jgi:hypothetical protein